MNIEFRKSFQTDLRHLKDRKIKRQIQAIIEEIESAKSLTELRNVIALVRLLPRKEMYRYFP